MAQIGFPLDSKIIGYDDSGLPIYSHQYHSVDYRNVLKEMFSNGVLSSGDMLKPAAYYLGGNTFEITVRPGAAIINGAIFINDGVEVYQQAIPAAPSGGQVTKHYHVVIGLDTLKTNGDENMTMYIKPAIANQSPAEDLKSSEICLATATVIVDSLASEPYVTFVDRRLDPDWCGLAAPFAELDTSQFYYDLQKDIEKLNDQTNTAVELAKDALDENVAGNLTERIGSLEDDAALIANGKELSINNNSLTVATVPGSYYIDADDLSKYNDLPDDWPDYFTRLYIVDIGKNISGYESVMQVLITRFSYETGKWKSDTRTRIINRDSATVFGSSPWQKILTGKVSGDDIKDGAITSNKLSSSVFDLISLGSIDNNAVTITSSKFKSVSITSFLKFGEAYIANCTVQFSEVIEANQSFSMNISKLPNKTVARVFAISDILIGYGTDVILCSTNLKAVLNKNYTFALLIFTK